MSRVVTKLPKYANIVAVAGREPDVGVTSRTVAGNVERLRKAQNMNYTQLSERLEAAADWTINAVGIRRIESGERRVTPDDLTALAVALRVSPTTLLMPFVDDGADPVEVTGFPGKLQAVMLWDWLSADNPLPAVPEHVRALGPTTRGLFGAFAWPTWVEKREIKESIARLMAKLKELGVAGVGDDQ
jgi:transcriptional regulator with XRE-family HTH domain